MIGLMIKAFNTSETSELIPDYTGSISEDRYIRFHDCLYLKEIMYGFISVEFAMYIAKRKKAFVFYIKLSYERINCAGKGETKLVDPEITRTLVFIRTGKPELTV